MNEQNMIDLLCIKDALSLVTEITGIAEMDSSISLGGLSCLIWLCQNKLDQVTTEIQTRLDKVEQAQLKAAGLI